MPSFILRNLDPDFWAKVQAKAKAENTTVYNLIIRLLTAWLAAVLVLGMVACAETLRTSPSTVITQPQAGVPTRLELNASPGIGAQGGTGVITARVLDGLSGVVPGITVTFSASEGTLDAPTSVTDGNGLARVSLTGPSGAVIDVSASTGALASKTKLAMQPVPPPPPVATPLPIPQPPPPPPPLPPSPPPAPVTLSVKLSCTATVPTTNTIDCTATVTNTTLSDAVIAYQWDLDGTAGFEATTTTNTRTSGAQATAGLFTAQVKVTTAAGRTATGTTGFVVTSP